MSIKTRVPTSDISVAFSRSTGSYNYATIDEYPATNDSDYNYQSSGVKSDLFGFTAFDVPAGSTINSVTLYLRAKAGTSYLGWWIRVGGNEYTDWVHDWGDSFNEKTKTWTVNPDTGLPWTINQVNGSGDNALQAFGYYGNTGAEEQDVSRLYIASDYTEAFAPTVTTTGISVIRATTASSGGNVTDDGGAEVTARGVCWNDSGSPTIEDDHTTDGSGTGVFTSSITGLTQNTDYYVRAYATNIIGTSYGSEENFTSLRLFPMPCRNPAAAE